MLSLIFYVVTWKYTIIIINVHAYKRITKIIKKKNPKSEPGTYWTVFYIDRKEKYILLYIYIFVTEDKQRCHHSYSCFSAWWILFRLKNVSQRLSVHIYTHTHNQIAQIHFNDIVIVFLLLLYSFFSVYSRCCRPWLHCCELCAHLSYGFIICCSLFQYN